MHLHLKASLAQFLIIIYEACQQVYVDVYVDDDDMQIRRRDTTTRTIATKENHHN